MSNNFRCAYALAIVVVGGCFLGRPLGAQQSRVPPAAIGQIVDEVLNAVVPLDAQLSRVSVKKRKIFLDHQRTLMAFGYSEPQVPLAEFELQRVLLPGRKSLLDDCDDFGAKPCTQLGWSVYAWIAPLSLTPRQAVVRAYFMWPDRGSTSFQDSVSPKGFAALVGFYTDVELTRSIDGKWKFVKRRGTMAG